MPSRAGDRQLETAVAPLLQGQDPEGDNRRHQPGGEQRHVEEQVQPDRRPDELGQVGRHRDQLCLHPKANGHSRRKMRTAKLRQIESGSDADLGGQVLHQHGH